MMELIVAKQRSKVKELLFIWLRDCNVLLHFIAYLKSIYYSLVKELAWAEHLTSPYGNDKQ